jgi:putative hydrolase of the HAD superfamily
MATTLVVPKNGQADHREPWEITREIPAHVDYVTDDLGAFLARAAPTPPPAAR